MMKFNPFKSMTFWGTLTAVGSYIVHHVDPAALSPTATAIVQGIGIIVAVIGGRNAVAKNGAGK